MRSKKSVLFLGIAWAALLLYLWAAPAQAANPWWDPWRGPVATLMSQAIVENAQPVAPEPGFEPVAPLSNEEKASPGESSPQPKVETRVLKLPSLVPAGAAKPPPAKPVAARKLIGYKKVCSGGVCRYEPVYADK